MKKTKFNLKKVVTIVACFAVTAMFLRCKSGGNAEIEMIFVEGGTFTMGNTDGAGNENEYPAHEVTLKSFNIGKYEITQGQWKAVMGTDIKQMRNKVDPNHALRGKGDNYPMYYISWDDAQEFIVKLNQKTGKSYRLPTEAEWEYAARGGAKSNNYTYSGSNNIDNVAWYGGNSNDNMQPVGTKQPNELGIYDMSGNVWEWCSDWYEEYSSDPQINPAGPAIGANRVQRGGSWYSKDGNGCRVTRREHGSPDYRRNRVGFRLALSD
jgi:formylglycine-generating enzyme required for sulfatase activity